MSEKRAGRELVKWAAVTLAVLLGLYVGAYYVLVEPLWFGDDAMAFYRRPGSNRLPASARDYRFTLRVSRFFAPIHWLDRHIRPHVWESEPLPGVWLDL